jgi:hypothetical protein
VGRGELAERRRPTGQDTASPVLRAGRSEVTDEAGTSVEWYLGYGDWIRVLRNAGLLVEDLIELRPASDATTTYTTYTTLEWARDFPGDHIWVARKTTRRPTRQS